MNTEEIDKENDASEFAKDVDVDVDMDVDKEVADQQGAETDTTESDVEITEEDSDCEQEEVTVTWEQEREDLVNQIIRLKADFDNYKRRNLTQMETLRQTANENLISDFLPVLDNFQRAIQATKEDSPLISGVKMVYNQLMETLVKQGLDRIDSVGERFDPNYHEAVSMDGDSGDNLVVTAELQTGYIYKGKVLRASMVQVAPATQEEEE